MNLAGVQAMGVTYATPHPPFLRNKERLYFFMVENNNIYNIPQYFAETSEWPLFNASWHVISQ